MRDNCMLWLARTVLPIDREIYERLCDLAKPGIPCAGEPAPGG